ncbi:tubulin-tyrosine ligase family-domain-containing protein, partial [Phlyctochytrium arcticum]
MSASNFPIKRPSNLPNNQAKPPLYKSSSRNETAIKEEPKSERSDSPSTIPKKKAKKKPACITVNTDNCKYDIVRDCCQKLGYRIVEDVEPCILFWIDTGASVERILGMQPYQKINHFPGMHEICRKDRLARNLNRLSRMFPKDANFFPKTWVLPAEWKDFVMNQRNAKKRQYYISKPDHGCQGKGIFLFKNPEQVLPLLPTLKGNANLIVQSYLHRPLLIDGYKFDLRVYVLVTSADPLRVFIYKDGLARFATEPYQEPNEGNVENVCMHLTNYAINKNSDNFVHDIEDGKGSKRSIRAVLKFLAATRGAANAESLWKRIGDVVIKTLLTVQPQLKRNLQACFPNSRKPELAPEAGTGEEGTKAKAPTLENMRSSQCFEILGFDIFVDHKLKPWVLEVNHSPSFTCDSTLDVKMKGGVICDTLKLLNLNSMVGKRFIAEEKAKAVGRL